LVFRIQLAFSLEDRCSKLVSKLLRMHSIAKIIQHQQQLNEGVWSIVDIMMTRGNLSIVRKTCPNTTFCTIISTLAGLGSNPGLCNDRQGTNHLCHGEAYIKYQCEFVVSEKKWAQ
jgi:hypothetical protein